MKAIDVLSSTLLVLLIGVRGFTLFKDIEEPSNVDNAA